MIPVHVVVVVVVVVVEDHGKIILFCLNHPVAEGGITPHSEIILGDEPPCIFNHPVAQSFFFKLKINLFLLNIQTSALDDAVSLKNCPPRDTYWIVRALLCLDMTTTVRGIVENFLYMVETHGIVPNGGRIYYNKVGIWSRSMFPKWAFLMPSSEEKKLHFFIFFKSKNAIKCHFGTFFLCTERNLYGIFSF